MDVDVLDFYGCMDVKVFTDWITTLEDYFEWYNMDEGKRVPFVRLKMKGATHVWWWISDERNANHWRPPISRWEETKEKLEDKYLPFDYVDSLFDQPVDCRQGTSIVDDFTERFHDRMVRCKVFDTNCHAICRYK